MRLRSRVALTLLVLIIAAQGVAAAMTYHVLTAGGALDGVALFLPVALILGMSVILTVVGAIVIARGVSRPMEAFAAIANRIAAGDYAPAPKGARAKELEELGIALDGLITAVSQREAALTEAMTDLATERDEALQASTAKSHFLTNMSHELRTPLNAVIGFGEVIETEIMGPVGVASYREYAKHIVESGRHLLARVDDMLDLTKLETGKLELQYEETDTREVLTQVIRALAPLARSNDLRLALRGDASVWPVINADPRKLRQVCTALIGNALKFTAKGGSVTLSCTTTASHVTIRITDTGIGIRAEDLPLVVKPFYRVNSSYNAKYQGVGLGLPLAKAITELHGGRMEIESTPGVGTTVSITLPQRLTARDSSAAA